MICLFKKNTAYEMLISDWSSDVCSSDLLDTDLFYRREEQLLKRDPGLSDLDFANLGPPVGTHDQQSRSCRPDGKALVEQSENGCGFRSGELGQNPFAVNNEKKGSIRVQQGFGKARDIHRDKGWPDGAGERLELERDRTRVVEGKSVVIGV